MIRVKQAILGVVILVALWLALTSYYTIDATERGVLLRTGAIVGEEQPGLHFKMPWLETVKILPVSTQILTLDKMEAYSSDQQPADIRISTTFHLDPGKISQIYAEYQTAANVEARLVAPRIQQQFKNIFGQFTAQQAIQERASLNAKVYDALAKTLNGTVVLEGIQIEDITFSPQYVQSIEQRMQAQIEVEKLQQNAQREKVQAQITVTQAQAAADAVRATADADAYATQKRGEAEAAAIKARGDALRDNPGLVALQSVEKWDGRLPVQMVPASALPFLNLPGPPSAHEADR
ncbi:Regulator of protease activity HflC, stomatin/prohibitin superfamily [Faunimonas pinastri]|uniref:Regulator of protease activity HflC, stomatin/prohibitin superfamily n=1 Tax=Faunimonas pinastri TaxID=1855383 RepID=A0A1H9PWT8_9HYPH|nr:prohibitin family protein [Faunimonas pinastri]SER52588.1 Regulator of protease activity HflC, stomatin/prohibitin superfamily [Faunimonas pinastri]